MDFDVPPSDLRGERYVKKSAQSREWDVQCVRTPGASLATLPLTRGGQSLLGESCRSPFCGRNFDLLFDSRHMFAEDGGSEERETTEERLTGDGEVEGGKEEDHEEEEDRTAMREEICRTTRQKYLLFTRRRDEALVVGSQWDAYCSSNVQFLILFVCLLSRRYLSRLCLQGVCLFSRRG